MRKGDILIGNSNMCMPMFVGKKFILDRISNGIAFVYPLHSFSGYSTDRECRFDICKLSPFNLSLEIE